MVKVFTEPSSGITWAGTEECRIRIDERDLDMPKDEECAERISQIVLRVKATIQKVRADFQKQVVAAIEKELKGAEAEVRELLTKKVEAKPE